MQVLYLVVLAQSGGELFLQLLHQLGYSLILLQQRLPLYLRFVDLRVSYRSLYLRHFAL
jgi:hypothetical protein